MAIFDTYTQHLPAKTFLINALSKFFKQNYCKKQLKSFHKLHEIT